MPELSPKFNPTPYLEYLDREMRILGILSTFCVAVAALIVNSVMNAAESSYLQKLWCHEEVALVICLGAILWAALEFFRQRHHYLFRYGQISLWVVHHEESKICDELRRAEAWSSQRRYKRGRLALYLTFIEFGIAVIAEAWPIEVSGWWTSDYFAILIFVGWLVWAWLEGRILEASDIDIELPVHAWRTLPCKEKWLVIRNTYRMSSKSGHPSTYRCR